MSDRKVAPPPARPSGASSLIRSVRESASPPQDVATQAVPEPTPVVESAAASVPLPQAPPAPVSGTSDVKMTVTVGEERRARLRTAYTLTHLQEGHRTFSDFISRALDAEVRRLEEKYNGGAEFKTAEQGVTRGRPLGS